MPKSRRRRPDRRQGQPALFDNSRLQKLAGTAWLAFMPADSSDRPKKYAPTETPHYHGHGVRLRERVHYAWPDALSDYELLEIVLFTAQPRRDMKPLAKSLLKKFGSFAEAVHAPETLLREVDGIGEASINQLKLSGAAASRIAKGQLQQRTLLSSWNDVISYCRTSMAVAHTPVYPREVIKRALELSATEIILVHNPPSGDPTPSQADIQMTRAIIDIAAPLGISVHDHIIVGRGGHASLKGLKLI